MKTFRTGIIGCGTIFPMHAASIGLTGTAQVTAVCDLKEERARQAAERYNCSYYTGMIRYSNGTEISRDKDPNEVIDYGEGVKFYWGVSHMKQIKAFYESLAAGHAPAIDGREALKTQELVASVYESGKNHKRVYLNRT